MEVERTRAEQVRTDFLEYVDQSSKALVRFAAMLTEDTDLARDIVQDVLVKAFRRWDRIGSLQRPHAYVRRMVVNELTSWRRKWARQVPSPDGELESIVDDPTVRADGRRDVLKRVSALPTRQRAAVILRYFEDLSDSEIGEALGCKPVTVRGYLHRAHKALRVDFESDTDPDPFQTRLVVQHGTGL